MVFRRLVRRSRFGLFHLKRTFSDVSVSEWFQHEVIFETPLLF